ncbi:EAL domain-containing protein [Deinococcus knuensis]|uniref:GGDEF-domain containing protein n=1 Tax=Deinococcus knuensis TaxID=1837380 RepID=A0ABQ2SEA0_9DEIO|nr:EAL domain-containing protein [Deinococcus knuensis]GGS17911.1 GGDEF-domain containing protein [Deinococcus knuensis]
MTHPGPPSHHSTAPLLEQLQALEAGMYHTPERSHDQITALLRQAEAQGDRAARAQAHLLLAGCALYTGDLPEVLVQVGHCLPLARELGDRQTEARALNGLGLGHDRLGQYDRALEAYLHSLRITQDIGDRTGSFRALNNLASLYNDTGNVTQALAFHQQALDIAEALSAPIMRASSMTHLIAIHDQMHRSAEVLTLAGTHLSLIREVGPPRWTSTVQECVSRALLRQDQPEEALRVALEDLRAVRARQDQEATCRQGIMAAHALLRLNRLQEAEPLLLESLRISREAGTRPQEALALQTLTDLFEQQGRHAQALSTAREHFDLERQMHAREVDARSQLLTAEIRLELLNREAEIERLRNVELAQANQALQETQQVLLHRATHDPLTGVANRAHFHQVTHDTLASLEAGQHAALIFIDLDRFKQVNDTLGHPAGDNLLQQVARRLGEAVRSTDLVGRMGGDEFTVLLRRVNVRDDVTLVAQKLADALARPFTLGGQRVNITASVGCAVAPTDGTDAGALQQHADLAMYRVKRSGGNQVLHFEAGMGEPGDRQQLERDLRGACERGEMRLHYQGRYDLCGLRLAGFEALVRWEHPTRGQIPPGQFIPLAEDSRAILSIGEWVLREACTQAVQWEFERRGQFMSVNVSPLQFELPDFVQTVRSVLEHTGLNARHLILEVTESLVMHDLERAQTHVRDLKALGVQIAIDDFGTGYSSLSMLQALPFDQLKIDRSFTNALTGPRAPRVTALMTAMIQLAQTLDMTVTVEGIETEEQRQVLTGLGCDHAQGFLLARPLPGEQAGALVHGSDQTSPGQASPGQASPGQASPGPVTPDASPTPS